MKTSVLKPGLLVSLKTTIKGGVSYARTELEREHADGNASVAKWETTRVIHDAAEYERAGIARSKARSIITGVCVHSAFGLLCPSDKEGELADAITSARLAADQHNNVAALTRVEVYVLVGRIAQDDAEAARAIGAEVRELMEDMERAVKLGDVEAIREAANKARSLGGMLTEETANKVGAAVAEARKIAREIVRRVEKAGESAATVVQDVRVSAIEAARFAFLDLDDKQASTEAPAARPVDFEPTSEQSQAAPLAPLNIELE